MKESENIPNLFAGERLREGANINKSLLVLGQVISKLSDGSREHIPFRNSKLTRILKDSLGGNAKTSIICTVTPAEREQTKSTLEFASRAKTIVQHVTKNEVISQCTLFNFFVMCWFKFRFWMTAHTLRG